LKQLDVLDPNAPGPQFHDRAVVASLKPDPAAAPVYTLSEFHDRAVVASLKQPWRGSGGAWGL